MVLVDKPDAGRMEAAVSALWFLLGGIVALVIVALAMGPDKDGME